METAQRQSRRSCIDQTNSAYVEPTATESVWASLIVGTAAAAFYTALSRPSVIASTPGEAHARSGQAGSLRWEDVLPNTGPERFWLQGGYRSA